MKKKKTRLLPLFFKVSHLRERRGEVSGGRIRKKKAGNGNNVDSGPAWAPGQLTAIRGALERKTARLTGADEWDCWACATVGLNSNTNPKCIHYHPGGSEQTVYQWKEFIKVINLERC